ncbi:hypothetical protein HanPI659440_Chr08g0299421 [Helianthus annuus]|nr:hypothetical protein HanPI659440_Chr08g0299421 [Helianthus annuus]
MELVIYLKGHLYLDLKRGFRFGSNKVVRNIIGILKEHLEGPWVTFPDAPNDVTRWSWDPRNEQMNYEGFRNVLKNRYRDIMAKMRNSAIKDAKNIGHVFERKDLRLFSKLSQFPPSHLYINIWHDMYLGHR